MNVPWELVVLPGAGPGWTRVLLGLAGLLVLGTVVRGAALFGGSGPEALRRWRSVGTWWVLFVLLVVVLALGRAAALVVVGCLSLLALREAVRLVGFEERFRWFAAAAVAVYGWAWLDWSSLFTLALPAALALLGLALAVRRARSRATPSPSLDAATAFTLAVLGPSFVVGAASLPPAGEGAAPLGWFMLLVLLTELNDIAQALFGRRLGARRLAPRLSPGKTWEGFVGGVATTLAAAVVLAPTLTGWGRVSPPGVEEWGPPWLWSAALGALIAPAGLAGDLAVSKLKRRAGVKDSGSLLPGQGGVLDRLDSLAATAPLFFLLTWALWIRP